tara:strand:+ start:229 stop:2061 length:1833 start_codon:yes stop_codon:yes gene_type:complete
MKKEILKYLKKYTYDTLMIDRLIVSSFLCSNKLSVERNELILKYKILETEIDEFKVLKEFLAIHKKVGFEELIELFEFVISPEDKVVTGAVYTPNYIREFIVKEALNQITLSPQTKICDPACGCSGFLLTAAREIKKNIGISYKSILENNIYGLDIQPYSIERSKILLNLLALSEGEDYEEINIQLFYGNALSFQWDQNLPNFEGFDVIVGNPPYVCSRNIDDESLELLKNWSVCSSGHPDLYIPFFQLGVEFLRNDGVLGYITVNSFFKSMNGRSLRDYFQDSKYDFRIIDFGGLQIFKSKNTYTCICLIQKSNGKLKYAKINNIKQLKGRSIPLNIVEYSSLDFENGWNLQNSKLINKIESIGETLGKKYRTRNGIATLKNNVYVFNPIEEDDDFFYLQNGQIYPIEKAICTEIVNPNKLTKLDSIESIRQKVIFPYTRENNSVNLLDEQVLQQDYPYTFQYLSDKRDLLAKRDKGNADYENWYAYGRNQSLERYAHKMFFPHITPNIPNFVINNEENLLFYNGLALIADTVRELEFMKRIMSSRLFWFYIINSSKPYGSGYFSLSRNYIKNFGIYDFNEEEINLIIAEDNQEKLNQFIESKYDIELS